MVLWRLKKIQPLLQHLPEKMMRSILLLLSTSPSIFFFNFFYRFGTHHLKKNHLFRNYCLILPVLHGVCSSYYMNNDMVKLYTVSLFFFLSYVFILTLIVRCGWIVQSFDIDNFFLFVLNRVIVYVMYFTTCIWLIFRLLDLF